MNSKKLKILLIILLLMFFSTALCAYKYKSELNAQRFYKQGMSFYTRSNYSDAYYNFKQIGRLSTLYTPSLLKQYLCAIKLNDKKTAHNKLTEAIRFTRNKNIRPYILYNEAILAMELGINNKNQSIKKFKKIMNNYPDNDFYYASAYKIASLSDDKYLSKDKYVEYLDYAPIGKYSTSAIDKLNLMKDILTQYDREIIANSYFANSKYEDALKFYKKTDFSKNWFKISKCYRFLNNKEEEKQTIIDGLNLEKSEVSPKDIDLAINRFIALSSTNKIQLLQDLYVNMPQSYIYPTVIYNLAESTQPIRSINLYKQIVDNYPDSEWASNSLWEIFWYNYMQGRYKYCISLAQDHQKKYSKSSDAPRVLYWSAMAMLHEKKNQNARETFYKILKEYPLSYYAFMSARRLKYSKAKKIIVKKPLKDFNINSLNKFLFADDKMLLFFANNDDYKMIEELKLNDENIKSWIMYKKQDYPNAINTAKNSYLKQMEENEEFSASYSDKELKFIYPILYYDEINKWAQEYNQSPYLFISIIREESHFNKNAKSSAGATGLVQLMPATASFIESLQITQETLKNENIRIGLKYFKYLLELFDNNEYLAILAYNAGPGNVKKWLNDPYIGTYEIDEFVENIPYLETKNYIKKVLSAYWIYFNIYK